MREVTKISKAANDALRQNCTLFKGTTLSLNHKSIIDELIATPIDNILTELKLEKWVKVEKEESDEEPPTPKPPPIVFQPFSNKHEYLSFEFFALRFPPPPPHFFVQYLTLPSLLAVEGYIYETF